MCKTKHRSDYVLSTFIERLLGEINPMMLATKVQWGLVMFQN